MVLDSLLSAKLIGASGYGCVIIDVEHGPTPLREATLIVHSIGLHPKAHDCLSSACLPTVSDGSNGACPVAQQES